MFRAMRCRSVLNNLIGVDQKFVTSNALEFEMTLYKYVKLKWLLWFEVSTMYHSCITPFCSDAFTGLYALSNHV